MLDFLGCLGNQKSLAEIMGSSQKSLAEIIGSSQLSRLHLIMGGESYGLNATPS